MNTIEVAAFYHFASLPHFADLQKPLKAMFDSHAIFGMCLVAPEGVNGTVAGTPDNIALALAGLRDITGLAQLEHKSSYTDTMPFRRMKVRLKREIVTMHQPSVDPTKLVGRYVDPEDWNALISDPSVIVLDTRNHFEVRLGTFKGAIDPETTAFGEFPAYVRQNLGNQKHRKVAMFCTGGIRCEKASSFMLAEGFNEVYHLKGGILKYLEHIPQEESLWDGGCFVFDRRIAVGHGLAVEKRPVCDTCYAPLDENDLASNLYEPGVCCAHCTTHWTEAQKASARERLHQQKLAQKRASTVAPAKTVEL